LPIVNGDDHDETGHFQYIQFVTENHRLPLSAQDRTQAGHVAHGGQPPLYHLLASLGLFWVNAEDISFITPPALNSYLTQESTVRDWELQTVRLNLPYEGPVLLWHLSRFYSSILGAAAVLMTYVITLELFPGQKGRALTAAALLAFIPRFVFMGSTINNDNLLALLMAIYLFLMVRLIKGHTSWPYLTGIGLTLGLGINTKLSIVLVPLTTILLFGFLAWRKRWSLMTLAKRVFLILIIASLVAGWWLLLVFLDASKAGTDGLMGAVYGAVPDAAKVLEVTQGLDEDQSYYKWVTYLNNSFWEARLVMWSNSFVLSFHAPWVIWTVMGLIGVGIAAAWWQGNEFRRTWIGFFLLHSLAVIPLMLARHQFTDNIRETAQGRHVLMPAGAAVGILLMAGWSYWTRPRPRLWLGPILPGFFLFWSVIQLYFIYHFSPHPLPVSNDETTRSRVPPVEVTVNRTLFDNFELVGYSTEILPAQSTLNITLVWEGSKPSMRDYLTEILLLDERGQTVSSWVGHPANGAYPTRVWLGGDLIYDIVVLPLHSLEPGSYVVEAYLLDGYERPVRKVTEALFTRPITLERAPKESSGFQTLRVDTGDETIFLKYQTWPFDFFDFTAPLYRYRATIPIAWETDPTLAPNQTITLKLVSPAGQTFEPLNEAGNVKNFMVEADWPAGFYGLNVEIWQDGELIGTTTWPKLLQVENEARQFTVPPLTYPVEANFYDTIKLLGYELSTRRPQPGEVLSMTLYWQSLQTVNRRFMIFNYLYDADNNLWLANEYESPPIRLGTAAWVPGEIVTDEAKMWLDPKIPAGIYTVHVGLFVELGDDQIRLPLVIDGEVSDVSHVALGPIKIGGPPPAITVESVRPQRETNVLLGGVVSLVGYDVAPQQVSESATPAPLEVTFYWQALATMNDDYTVFVHIKNEAGEVVAQKDGPPAGGIYPTSLWDIGETIEDETVVPLDRLEPGSYELVVGLYDPVTGERLTVAGTADNFILLQSIELD
jgi:hypothetical protein